MNVIKLHENVISNGVKYENNEKMLLINLIKDHIIKKYQENNKSYDTLVYFSAQHRCYVCVN